MSFKASMEALQKDAKRWDDTAEMLQTAKSDCAAMTLRAQDFSFMGGEVHKEYEEIRDFMEDYLADGQRATSGAADALRKVHETYQGSDDNAKERLKSSWEWE